MRLTSSAKRFYSVEITTVIGCARLCTYCPQENLRRSWRSLTQFYETSNPLRCSLLSRDGFKKHLDALPKDIYIFWTGFAEPLQCPEFHHFVDLATERGIISEISTTLFSPNSANIESLCNREHFSRISLHLPDDDGEMKAHIDQEYLNRLDFVVKECLRPGDHIHFFGRLHSKILSYFKEPSTAKLLKDISVSEIPLDSKEGLTSRAGNLSQNGADQNQVTDSVLCAAKRLRQPVLLPNGDLYLCCMDYSLSSPIGNIYRDSYEDIVESNIRAFSNSQPDICHKCEWSVSKTPLNRLKHLMLSLK